jgi:hypothetical protein
MSRLYKRNSSSFIKFIARLQNTFSSKTTKSSTVIIQQQSHTRVCIQLSQILFDPSRPNEYLSEIKDNDDDSDSFSSCDSISLHSTEQFNLSQMNISMDNSDQEKLIKLPNALDTIQLHSTAIHDISSL